MHCIIKSLAVTESRRNEGEETPEIIDCHPLRFLIIEVVNKLHQE
jgi:hypothetical protein